jgi:hypothetical protein
MSTPTTSPDFDSRPTPIARFDAINAAGAMTREAIRLRRESRLRRYAGPAYAPTRAMLRSSADDMEAGAKRVQAAADAAL